MMTLKTTKRPTIGLVEVPATGLYDSDGKNWTSLVNNILERLRPKVRRSGHYPHLR